MPKEDSGSTSVMLGEDEVRERRVIARVDFITMLVFTGIGLWVMIKSSQMRLTNALGVGPGMFPFISGLLLGGLGLVGCITRIRSFKVSMAPRAQMMPGSHDLAQSLEAPLAEEEMFTMVKWGRIGLVMLFLGLFAYISSYVGFVFSLAVLTFSLMFLVAKRPLRLSLITTVAVAAVTYFGFGVFLGVQFPPPSLSFLSFLS